MAVQRIKLLKDIGVHKAGDIVHVHLDDIRRLKLRNLNKHFPNEHAAAGGPTHDAFGTFPQSPAVTHLTDVADVAVTLLRPVALHKAGETLHVSSANLARLGLEIRKDYIPANPAQTVPLTSQCPLHFLDSAAPITVTPEPPADNSGPAPENPAPTNPTA